MHPHEVNEELEKIKPVSSDYSIVQVNYLEIGRDNNFISKVQETNHLEEFRTPPISTIDWVAIDKDGHEKQLGKPPSISVDDLEIASVSEAVDLTKQNDESGIEEGLRYIVSSDELDIEDQRRCSKHVSRLLDHPNEAIRNRAAEISGILRRERIELAQPFVKQLSEIAGDEELITLTSFSYGYAANRNKEISSDLMDLLIDSIDEDSAVESINQLLALGKMAYKYPDIAGLKLDRLLELVGSSKGIDKGVYELINTLAFQCKELPPGVEVDLLDLLDSPEEDIRELSCYTIGYLEEKQNVDVLRDVRESDSSEAVRESAHRAIMWIEGEDA